MAALALPLLLLLATTAILGPIVYRGSRAYQEIFIDPVPRTAPAFVAVRDPQGTPVIASTTATPATVPSLPTWDGTDRITILLLGVDRREGELSRADTIILVNVDPVAKRAGLLSIPRDLKVMVPGYGFHKINAAYAFGEANDVPGGGPGLTISTIETNFGIRVDYFAEVDFNGFVKIVDTVGGVTIDVPYPIKDDAYPAAQHQYMRVYFPTGWQHMDGERALQYARTRHDDGDSRRSLRQQQLLLALRDQAVRLDLLPKAGELLAEVGDAVRTDLSPTQALQLARLASEITDASINQHTILPALTPEERPGQPYFLLADWDAVGRILSDFTGAEVTPPMAALAHPRRDFPIRIEDGSAQPDLAERIADVLRHDGFVSVTVVARAAADSIPTTAILTAPPDLSTAILVAGLIGVAPAAVVIREWHPTPVPSGLISPSPSPVASPMAPGSDAAGIVVILGPDARDPADFTVEPFVHE